MNRERDTTWHRDRGGPVACPCIVDCCDRPVEEPCDGCADDEDCGGGMKGICCARMVPGGTMGLPKALTAGRG